MRLQVTKVLLQKPHTHLILSVMCVGIYSPGLMPQSLSPSLHFLRYKKDIFFPPGRTSTYCPQVHTITWHVSFVTKSTGCLDLCY